jgi:hypothetical protein
MLTGDALVHSVSELNVLIKRVQLNVNVIKFIYILPGPKWRR